MDDPHLALMRLFAGSGDDLATGGASRVDIATAMLAAAMNECGNAQGFDAVAQWLEGAKQSALAYLPPEGALKH